MIPEPTPAERIILWRFFDRLAAAASRQALDHAQKEEAGAVNQPRKEEADRAARLLIEARKGG